MSEPLITFLSDYGRADEFVGVCHGVIARRCPAARVIDITHSIPSFDVRTGALVLADALVHMPAGVHLAVVDPQVGSRMHGERAALALRTAEQGRVLVGPDNGLLMIAAERFGGAVEAVEISRSREVREPVSNTFHGRDVFAPVAAALADGEPLQALGASFEVARLQRIELPVACLHEHGLAAQVLRADHFGNLILSASGALLAQVHAQPGDELALEVAGRVFRARLARAFADVRSGELLVYEDANEAAAIALNGGSAAARLAVSPDDEIVVRPA